MWNLLCPERARKRDGERVDNGPCSSSITGQEFFRSARFSRREPGFEDLVGPQASREMDLAGGVAEARPGRITISESFCF